MIAVHEGGIRARHLPVATTAAAGSFLEVRPCAEAFMRLEGLCTSDPHGPEHSQRPARCVDAFKHRPALALSD